MLRVIEGFRQDEVGDWVADLACLHGQHVRHQPPFNLRPWVERPEGRSERIGTSLDCPLCDRGELPEGLRRARTAGPFDADSLPAGLRRDHRVAEHTWAVLRVLEGGLGFSIASGEASTKRLAAGDRQVIPPGVAHAVVVDGPCRLAIDFLVRP